MQCNASLEIELGFTKPSIVIRRFSYFQVHGSFFVFSNAQTKQAIFTYIRIGMMDKFTKCRQKCDYGIN